MLPMVGKVIMVMAGLRLISGSIEFLAGLLILKLNSVEKALMVNAVLATIGPLFFIASMTLGIIHIADKISYSKLFFIGLGVTCIFIGLKK